MEETLNISETSEIRKEKKSVWYNIFHWAILIYVFAVVVVILYGGYLFIDYLVKMVKSWM